MGAVCIAAATVGTASAATLQVDTDGVLVGATGLNVNGTIYDVAFVDGSCASIFDGCDEPSDFDFTNASDAVAVGQALFDQVFVGIFDTLSGVTFGCGGFQCVTRIPTGFVPTGGAGAEGAIVINNTVIADPSVNFGGINRLFNYANSDTSNYALFTETGQEVSPIPLPAGFPLMAVGMGALMVLRQRKKSKSV
ncbi:MAG: VPLPA-CTERM sorting domain-containing protein [Pseudomonadota bacterium]